MQANAVPVRPWPPRQPSSTRSPARALSQQRSQGGHHGSNIAGHAEIGPVEVIVGPRRFPLRVEIQTEIRSPVVGVGIPDVKRNGSDFGPVRQHNNGSMEV